MWIILIIIVAIIIGKFIFDSNEQNKSVAQQGGMDYKYRDLIAILLAGDERAKIHQLTSSSVTIGSSSAGGVTLFNLIQSYGKLKIEWRMESPLFGKHKLDWTFNEFMNQYKMAEIIMNDLNAYQENVLGSKGIDF